MVSLPLMFVVAPISDLYMKVLVNCTVYSCKLSTVDMSAIFVLRLFFIPGISFFVFVRDQLGVVRWMT